MHKPLLGLLILLLAPSATFAQTTDGRRAWASLTAGAGRDVQATNPFVSPPVFGLVRGSVGTGSAWLGVQGSLGYVSEGGGEFGDGSVEGVVRLRRLTPDTRGPVPYVFAGPGLFFAPGGTELKFNFGGGVDYFRSPRWGLRFEVRDSVVSEDAIHHLEFSGGIVFRF